MHHTSHRHAGKTVDRKTKRNLAADSGKGDAGKLNVTWGELTKRAKDREQRQAQVMASCAQGH